MAQTTKALECMTPEQREQWDDDGYVVIKSALSAEQVERLTAEVDRLDEESQRRGRDPDSLFDVADILDTAVEGLFHPDLNNRGVSLQSEPNDAFLELVDHPRALGLVCETMGAAVQVTWSQALVRSPSAVPSHRWHPDGPKPYYFPRVRGMMPLLQIKVGFFLSDVDGTDMGNLCVIPGSHRNGFPKVPQGLEHALKITSYADFREVEEIDRGVPGARQIMVQAGDAVAMHCGVFHCVVRNTSNVRRKNLYYSYGPMWKRAGDRIQSSPELIARCSPVQKQLLGALAGPNTNGGYHAFDEGAPLIELFEGKGFHETLAAVDDEYIRATQA